MKVDFEVVGLDSASCAALHTFLWPVVMDPLTTTPDSILLRLLWDYIHYNLCHEVCKGLFFFYLINGLDNDLSLLSSRDLL